MWKATWRFVAARETYFFVLQLNLPKNCVETEEILSCRIAPSLPTSTPSRWPPARASTTTSARSRGRMARRPPSPSTTRTSRVRTRAPIETCVTARIRAASSLTFGFRVVQPSTARATKQHTNAVWGRSVRAHLFMAPERLRRTSKGSLSVV
jgi:hypothetical protein